MVHKLDLRRVDLNLLVTLDVLLREPGVTQAARVLNLSQPAVSARLVKLRELFDDPLFVQRGRNLVPTRRARELAPPLQRLLVELGGLLDPGSSFDPSTADRVFRIAGADTLHMAVTTHLVEVMLREAPGCRLSLMTPSRDRFDRLLGDGEVDLLLAGPAYLPEAAARETLFEERFLCAARRGHPAFQGALDLDTYCDLKHVLVAPKDAGFFGYVDGELAVLDRARRVVVSVSSFLLVPEILERTDLVCTMPSRLARLWAGRLDVATPPLGLSGFTLQMGWNPMQEADQGLAWLRARLREICETVARER